MGICGLMGAGRTELAMSIFGKSYGVNISGMLKINGEEVKLYSVREAIRHKLAYVTEDRKGNGLILSNPIKINTTLANMGAVSRHTVIDKNREYVVADEYREKLNTKCPSVDQNVGNLSGGNQQKVILAKWMVREPAILILDEPTAVLTPQETEKLFSVIRNMKADGKAVIIITHKLYEVMAISDRVGVMYLGHLVEEGDTDEVFDHPQHPYTRTLMSAVPSIDPRDNRQRILLEGDLPSPIDPPSGCVFHTRCPWATEACKTASCELREVRKGHYAACSRGEQE